MPKFHPLVVKEIRRESRDCVSVAFAVPAALQTEYAYLPGQFITLKATVGGEELRRSYSLCTSPLEQDWRVAIKAIPGGRFSNFVQQNLKVGQTLEVMTPMGNFHPTLPPAPAKRYVAFAAGSGITPIMAIIKTILWSEPDSHFTLFYGNRTKEDIIFRETLEALKNEHLQRFSFFHVLSQEDAGLEPLYGRIDAVRCRFFLEKIIHPQAIDEFFLCGPEGMIADIREVLAEKGVERQRIHFELFTTGVERSKVQAVNEAPDRPVFQVQVKIVLDGNTQSLTMASDQQSILDAALANGADLPYACKGGVCATCRAKLLMGQVNLQHNYALEPDEIAAGYILTCQAYPESATITVDFDQ